VGLEGLDPMQKYADHFQDNSVKRQLSLKSRKEMMMEISRKKYLENRSKENIKATQAQEDEEEEEVQASPNPFPVGLDLSEFLDRLENEPVREVEETNSLVPPSRAARRDVILRALERRQSGNRNDEM